MDVRRREITHFANPNLRMCADAVLSNSWP